MFKIKFNSLQKRKGIVEEVFVSYGQPVTRGHDLAKIALSDGEIVVIKADNDGVIGDIKVVESVIVKPGDSMFEVLTSSDVEKLTRKPKKISTTLLAGLERFGIFGGQSNEIINEFDDESDSEDTNEDILSADTQDMLGETIIDESFLSSNLGSEAPEPEKKEKGSMTLFIDDIIDNKTAIFGGPSSKESEDEASEQTSTGEQMQLIKFSNSQEGVKGETVENQFDNENDEIDMTWSNLEINLENIHDNNDSKTEEKITVAEVEEIQKPFAQPTSTSVPQSMSLNNEPVTVSESITEELERIADLNIFVDLEENDTMDLEPVALVESEEKSSNESESLNEGITDDHSVLHHIEETEEEIVTLEEPQTEEQVEVEQEKPTILEEQTEPELVFATEPEEQVEEQVFVSESEEPKQEEPQEELVFATEPEPEDDFIPEVQVEDLNSDKKPPFIEENHEVVPSFALTDVEKLVDDKLAIQAKDWKGNLDKLVLEQEILISKINDIETNKVSEINSEIKVIKAEHSELLNKVKDNFGVEQEIANLKEKYDELSITAKKINSEMNDLLSKVSNLQNQPTSEAVEKTTTIKSSQKSTISFEVDVTALLNLHALMHDPFAAQGVDLELNPFYLKALKIVLGQTKVFTKKIKTLTLAKVIQNQLIYQKINLGDENTILELAKQTQTNKKTSEPSCVTLYDFGNHNITTTNLELPVGITLGLVVGDVQSKTKPEKLTSEYVNVSVTFDQAVITIEQAIEFTNKFNEIINNPGLLI